VSQGFERYGSAKGTGRGSDLQDHESKKTRLEAVMYGTRNERARARARHLLALVHPLPDDVDVQRLRALAMDYIREAERLEAEASGRAAESNELITAVLDAIARDFFKRALDKEQRRVGGGVRQTAPRLKKASAG